MADTKVPICFLVGVNPIELRRDEVLDKLFIQNSLCNHLRDHGAEVDTGKEAFLDSLSKAGKRIMSLIRHQCYAFEVSYDGEEIMVRPSVIADLERTLGKRQTSLDQQSGITPCSSYPKHDFD